MNHNYSKVIGCLLLSFSGYSLSIAQPTGPYFPECSSTPDSLCVQDEGVKLPANNQIYLGEGHPEATSCSVHVTQKKIALSTCAGPLQYEVQLFLNDTSSAYILKPLTIITPDSNGTAELYFNTEESPDAQISTAGIPYTAGCQVYHRIRWIVTDTCGMESVCEQRINLYDCNAPVTVSNNVNFTVVIPSECILILFAKDFDSGSIDDCATTQKLLRSFNRDSYQPNYPIGPCAPAYDVDVPWKIWIADAGVDSNCNGHIEWIERNRKEYDFTILFKALNAACCEPRDSVVSGKVIKANSTSGIKDVLVTLTEPGHSYPTYITALDGKYSFNVADSDFEKTITCERNDQHKNGVTTLDMVKIQKHIVGIEMFASPYQMIAADVNNSQLISAIDLVEIRKLILGIYSEFPHNKSWRFVPGAITFTDAMFPGNTDFIGVKIGDVNFTANPGFKGSFVPRDLQIVELWTENQFIKKETIINVPIRISSRQTLTGFQFTLSTEGIEILDVVPGSIRLTDGEFALFGDKMSISWFDESNVDVTSDEVLFTLVLRGQRAGNLSQSISINSDITDAEIYLDGEQTFLPVLNVVNPISEADLKIVSCAPNPWKDETTVFFYLPETSNVTYNVIDVNGRRVYLDNEYLKEGYHNYTLKATDFSAGGMLFLEVNAGGSRMVEKMVLME